MVFNSDNIHERYNILQTVYIKKLVLWKQISEILKRTPEIHPILYEHFSRDAIRISVLNTACANDEKKKILLGECCDLI